MSFATTNTTAATKPPDDVQRIKVPYHMTAVCAIRPLERYRIAGFGNGAKEWWPGMITVGACISAFEGGTEVNLEQRQPPPPTSTKVWEPASF